MLQRVKDLTLGLDLNDTQREQVNKLFKQASDDITNAAPDLQNASQEDKAAKYREIMTDLREQVAGVLTDDQKQELQQKMQSARQRSQTTATTAPTSVPTVASAPRPQSDAPRPGRGQQPMQRLRGALAQLDLSDDEKSKTDKVLDDLAAQLKQMRESMRSGNGDRAEFRTKIVSLLQDTRTKLSDILTPDQQQKLRSLLQQQPTDNSTPPRSTPTTVPAPADQMKAAQVPTPPAASAVASATPAAAPDIGQPAPDFSLKQINGQTINLADSKHHFLVLVFASATAPAFRDHAADLNALHDKFGSRGVDFLVVYTKEQHPVGGWELQRNKDDNISIPLAKTIAERTTAARQFHDGLHLSVPVAVDSMDDHVSTEYGVNQTVPAFVIDREGNIAFHQSWLEPDTLSNAIEQTIQSKTN